MSNVDDSNAASRLDRFRQKIRGLYWDEIAGLIAAAVLVIFFAAVIFTAMDIVDVSNTLSPDGTQRIVIRQRRPITLDRNFRIVLIDEATKDEREIFYSLDQLPTISQEHVVWSADGRYFALIGDGYYVLPGSQLPNGLTIFLVYDLETDQVYCNTHYVDRKLPRVTIEEAVGIFGKEALDVTPPARERD